MIYIIKDNNRKLTLIPSTPSFREMAAVVSVRTGEPLISDCTEIWHEDNSVFARKPSLDGKNFSKYKLDDGVSYVVLLKTSDAADKLLERYRNKENQSKNNQEAHLGQDNQGPNDSSIEIILIPYEDGFKELLYPLDCPRDEIKVTNVEKPKASGVHVKDAELIFSGGRGIMNKESFDALRKLAALYGASVGASRPMVDQGWATWDEQIGQTGSIVTPKVYVAFGISGAVQHITGIEKSQNIIAVNLNKTSPIFRYADYGVYSDDNSIIRNMLNLIEERS